MAALDLARLLLAAGANPNARIRKDLRDVPRQRSTGGTGSTPFFLAARTGDVDLMRVLLEYGADPFLPTANCRTPLMAAAGVGVSPGADPGTNEEALAAFTLLLDLGGDILAADAGGETPLHGAAERGANEVVQLLVDRGADLEAVNERGWTPLTIAEGVVRGVVFKQQPHTASPAAPADGSPRDQHDGSRRLPRLRRRRFRPVRPARPAALRRRVTGGSGPAPHAGHDVRDALAGSPRAYRGSERRTTAGTTNMFSAVEDTSPHTTTRASGA